MLEPWSKTMECPEALRGVESMEASHVASKGTFSWFETQHASSRKRREATADAPTGRSVYMLDGAAESS